jgi:nucleotide-binding universal stress UspA family protein
MTFGSVSAFLARRVKCPLLIVPTHVSAPPMQAAE